MNEKQQTPIDTTGSTLLQQGRDKFADHAVTTLSPARVVVMCFERVDRDLAGASTALLVGDLTEATILISHAQDIISHLMDGIEASDWEFSGELSSVYSWCYGELLSAVAHRSESKVSHVRGLLSSLGSAFSVAAQAVVQPVETAGGTHLRAHA